MSIRGEELLNQKVKIGLVHKVDFQERQSSEQFGLRGRVLWETSPDQQNAIYVIWLEDLGNEAPIEDQAHDPGTTCQINKSAQRLYLHTTQLRFATKTRFDFIERGRMYARWQVAMFVEGWNHRDTSCPVPETSTQPLVLIPS